MSTQILISPPAHLRIVRNLHNLIAAIVHVQIATSVHSLMTIFGVLEYQNCPSSDCQKCARLGSHN